MNVVLKDSNRFVQSQKNQEVLFVKNLWWKKIHQILTFPSFLPLETQDLDKDKFHPRVTSTPLPG